MCFWGGSPTCGTCLGYFTSLKILADAKMGGGGDSTELRLWAVNVYEGSSELEKILYETSFVIRTLSFCVAINVVVSVTPAIRCHVFESRSLP